jgi:hypothetical protein
MAFRTAKRPQNVELCGLAHDLNNDVTVIIGECECLDDLVQGQTDVLARVQLIKSVARRMADRIYTRPCPVKEPAAKGAASESPLGGEEGLFDGHPMA